jgi:nucleotide-binding universal stress UspA family protein
MTSVTTPSLVILAAVDGTHASDEVVRTAALLAQSLIRANAELHLLAVAEHALANLGPDAAMLDARSNRELASAARSHVAECAMHARQLFDGGILGHLTYGAPARGILGLAAELRADVIVVGTHGKRTIERWMLGSVSEQVVRKASCAVLVARPKRYPTEPSVEPPCPDCVVVRKASRGQQLWCVRHSARHVHAQLHYETPPTFGVGSTFLRPDG